MNKQAAKAKYVVALWLWVLPSALWAEDEDKSLSLSCEQQRSVSFEIQWAEFCNPTGHHQLSRMLQFEPACVWVERDQMQCFNFTGGASF